METVVSRLTILFEAPFWIGLYEWEDSGYYQVCRITFGTEPKDCEVYGFMLAHWNSLRFSPAVTIREKSESRPNPKRMQRLIQSQMQNIGIGTKAQQALKLQQEQGKLERKARSRKQREAEKDRQFELRQEKHKEKHRGH